MTRILRAIRFPRAFLILSTAFTASVLFLATGHAFADDMPQASVPPQALAGVEPAPAEVAGGAAGSVTQSSEAPGSMVSPVAKPSDSIISFPGGAAGSSGNAAAVAGGMADVPSSAADANAEQAGVQLLPSVERPLHHF
jgi:hypothetical protein